MAATVGKEGHGLGIFLIFARVKLGGMEAIGLVEISLHRVLKVCLRKAKLTYSNIPSVCPVPMLKFSHLSTLIPLTNGVNWKKEISFQLSLSLISALSHLSFSLLIRQPWQSWSKP